MIRKKLALGLDPRVESGFPKRSRSNKKLERDADRTITRPALMPLEAYQRAHRHAELADLIGAAELGQIDDEAGGQDLGADALEEFHRCLGGAAGRDQVVDQDD